MTLSRELKRGPLVSKTGGVVCVCVCACVCGGGRHCLGQTAWILIPRLVTFVTLVINLFKS